MDIAQVFKDPVCGMEKPVDQMKFSSDFKGKTYFFCSQMDKDMFDARPEHWIPKENETK